MNAHIQQSPSSQRSPKTRGAISRLSVVAIAIAVIIMAPNALALDPIIDIGPIDPFPIPPSLAPNPDGAINCWDNPGHSFDRFHWDAYIATIGGPATYRQSSTPLFKPNNLDAYQDALVNPGTHYRDATYSAPFSSGLGAGLTGFTVNRTGGTGGTLTPIGRFLDGELSVSSRKVTAKIVDDKSTAALETGASVFVATWQQTFDVTRFWGLFNPGGVERLGGALAFDVTLPKWRPGNPFPGAAAVTLTTRLATDSNFYDSDGRLFSDAGCSELATIGATVSEGISDGENNANTGSQENLFGNTDVAIVTKTIPGSFDALNTQGNVQITSTSVGLTQTKYHVAGTWTTMPFRLVPVFPGDAPPTITLTNTLTMIADPGAEISLVPLTLDDINQLDPEPSILVVASGTAVPEPASLMLMCLASGMMLLSRRS